nr:circumsporozoite protein-like [Aegilops tauschii subsp. strangulata]
MRRRATQRRGPAVGEAATRSRPGEAGRWGGAADGRRGWYRRRARGPTAGAGHPAATRGGEERRPAQGHGGRLRPGRRPGAATLVWADAGQSAHGGEESARSRQAQGSADAGRRRRRRARVGWEPARSRARWSAGAGGSGPLAGHGAHAVSAGAGASAREAWSRPATSRTRRGRSGGWAEPAPRVATRQAAREAKSGAAGAGREPAGLVHEADEQQGRESEAGSPGQGAGAAEAAGRWSGAGPDGRARSHARWSRHEAMGAGAADAAAADASSQRRSDRPGELAQP